MERGLTNGKITEKDIEEIFGKVKVGTKKGKEEVVYLKYKWNLGDMVIDINYFLEKKINNELDDYIEFTWENLYDRWREAYVEKGITIKDQIDELNQIINILANKK